MVQAVKFSAGSCVRNLTLTLKTNPTPDLVQIVNLRCQWVSSFSISGGVWERTSR